MESQSKQMPLLIVKAKEQIEAPTDHPPHQNTKFHNYLHKQAPSEEAKNSLGANLTTVG